MRLHLLNDWQRDFPLQREPFAVLARQLETDPRNVLATYRGLMDEGAVSRIGAVFAGGAGGAAMLCAMAVPPAQLQQAAAVVSAHPGVNHNYEREHAYNLWFVITGRDHDAITEAVDGLEARAGHRALRLPMLRSYRIDLGFDLRSGDTAPRQRRAPGRCAPVAPEDIGLAALAEDGLPLVQRPYDVWAEAAGRQPDDVLATLQRWLDQGTLRRFGVVVRHHELGFDANAMTVFDVPDEAVDRCGEALARQPGVTLAYRRSRAAGWPFNLYCMVHGRDRETVRTLVAKAIVYSDLSGYERAMLFSRRRFKQVGARRFRDMPEPHHAFA